MVLLPQKELSLQGLLNGVLLLRVLCGLLFLVAFLLLFDSKLLYFLLYSYHHFFLNFLYSGYPNFKGNRLIRLDKPVRLSRLLVFVIFILVKF